MSFFLKNLGSGSGGYFLVFLEEFRGSGFWIPVAGRANGLRMTCKHFVLAAEIPCEWKFATKFASDCEDDGLVHSGFTHSDMPIMVSRIESFSGMSPSST